MADVQTGVEKLLAHVMSIKALSSIKTAVHSRLAASPRAEQPDSAPWQEVWSSTCQLVLKRELSVWDTFFQAPLLQRVKVQQNVVMMAWEGSGKSMRKVNN